MNHPLNMDLRARAELLTYLVSSHLMARQLTGDWLSPTHVVESTTIWLNANGAGAGVMQRVMLSSRALTIAKEVESARLPIFSPERLATLFCENLRVDFRSESARAVYQYCLNSLVRTRWFE
ncbi:hypothetical protein [Paraburkholderia sp. DHOC27]|uniref:hypothetical protein n=1 Tax=Paraburkholderia sp. DHOC27 TaxID=2303330 RepID=UPI0011C136CB|nr:hypothetical protein [Paraburkholderia sp. DHOC27]